MRRITLALALFILPSTIHAQANHGWCGASAPSSAMAGPFVERLEHSAPPSLLPKATIAIPIAFHVVHDGKNGKVSTQQIATLIGNLNWAFRESPFTFYLYRADSIKNKGWYNNCVVSAANRQKLRKRLARDVRYYVNVYSCKPGLPGYLGFATFPPGYPVPGNPGLNYLQGIAIDPVALGSSAYPYGMALAHEIGHYLGLFHTFESFFNDELEGCADPGDYVGDTPTQASHTLGACPSNVDSCPTETGSDDIPNFMNYSSDECMDHFSLGQLEMIQWAIENYRPTLVGR